MSFHSRFFFTLVVSLLPVLVLTGFEARAQGLALLHTSNEDHLYVFDNGEFVRLDHRPAKSTWNTLEFVAYESSEGKFMFYSPSTGLIKLAEFLPTNLSIGDSRLTFNVGGILRQIHEGSLVIDTFGVADFKSDEKYTAGHFESEEFFVYRGKEDTLLEYSKVSKYKVKASIISYLTDDGILKTVDDHGIRELLFEPPIRWYTGDSYIAFTTEYDDFQLYQYGELFELESFTPTNVYPCNHFVAYITQDGIFKVAEGPKTIELSLNPPKKVLATDEVLFYIDAQGYSYAFQDGKSTLLEAYTVEDVKSDHQMIIYKDIDGKLKGYKNGRKLTISNETVTYFNLYSDVVIFSSSPREKKVYFNDKTYTIQH